MPIEKTCEFCRSTFRVPPSKSDQQYCSRQCWQDAPKDLKRAPRVKTNCLKCNKEIEIIKRLFDMGRGRFCSYSCCASYYPNYRHKKGTHLVPRITLHCQACGKAFQVTPGQQRRKKGRRFCSNACVNIGRTRPKTRIKLACKYCGKEFLTYPAWAKKGIKYCSRKCANISLAGCGMPQTEHIIKNCLQCGQEMDLMPYQASQRFCSQSCAYAYRGPTGIEELLMHELDARQIEYCFQYPVSRWSLDFAFPERKLAVEADGTYWHRRPETKEKDRRKDAGLRNRGWQVLRFTEDEIMESAQSCVDEIVKHLE